ncbi:hypothetical protein DFJ58DRAFT_727569 [Suillus subalutaceus]|uniref:uncharacterized protein n=1 Tax=Suillus subalutaceus TaxID=48586 RepID=UPI001B872CBA|nr:uncharacterized protein DFJ58DRAFT_727569 [Suillus subalutaceus]KAG1855366.1 hypothetical protein DFJ58DRAFT_727569 [Suillus subalutaceus]
MVPRHYQSHTGKELTAAFKQVLKDYGVTRKILVVTCNNVANNIVILEEMTITLSNFSGMAAHTRCFLHTINLVAKSLLQQFDAPKSHDHKKHVLNVDGEDSEDEGGEADIDDDDINGDLIGSSQPMDNIFDNIPALAPPKLTNLGNELNHHLNADVEHVDDPLIRWHECHATFP